MLNKLYIFVAENYPDCTRFSIKYYNAFSATVKALRIPGSRAEDRPGFFFLTPPSLLDAKCTCGTLECVTGGYYHSTTLVLRNETDSWRVYSSQVDSTLCHVHDEQGCRDERWLRKQLNLKAGDNSLPMGLSYPAITSRFTISIESINYVN